MFHDTSASRLEQIQDPLLLDKKISLFLKRDDLLHTKVSGNKWRKLKYNVQEALRLGHDQLLTFGGAFSNHILATAAAASGAGINSIGIVRGEDADLKNPTLSAAMNEGMKIKRISRQKYRNKTDDEYISSLLHEFGRFYLIPEGGSNDLAVKGVAEVMGEINTTFDYAVTAVGTGATMAGLISGSRPGQKVIGIPVLKGAEFLKEDILEFIAEDKNKTWDLIYDYHFGGYAKFNHSLIQFINNFKRNTSVVLDPIYTGKMMYGIFDLIKADFFKEGSKIVAIHTGGVQGIDGFNERFDKIIF